MTQCNVLCYSEHGGTKLIPITPNFFKVFPRTIQFWNYIALFKALTGTKRVKANFGKIKNLLVYLSDTSCCLSFTHSLVTRENSMNHDFQSGQDGRMLLATSDTINSLLAVLTILRKCSRCWQNICQTSLKTREYPLPHQKKQKKTNGEKSHLSLTERSNTLWAAIRASLKNCSLFRS